MFVRHQNTSISHLNVANKHTGKASGGSRTSESPRKSGIWRWLIPRAPREWVVYTITEQRMKRVASALKCVRAPKQMAPRKNKPQNTALPRDARGEGRGGGHLYVPTKTSDHVFLRFPEMLQGGHLLSWYHEILHARLSPVCFPPSLALSNSSVRRI